MTTLDLDNITLDLGSHKSADEGHCLLEVVSMFADEPFTDSPRCVSPYLRSFGIRLNDRATVERRQDLKQFIPLLVGTATDGKDELRRWLAADYVTRVTTPKWLDRAGLTEHAATLRGLAAIVDADTYRDSRPAVVAARDAAYALQTKAYGGKTRYRYFYDAAKAEIEKRGAAVAAAVADAVAVAVAAAVADAAAVAAAAAVAVAPAWLTYGTDAYWAYRAELRKQVDTKVRAVYEERYGDVVAESWADAVALYGRLIAAEVSA